MRSTETETAPMSLATTAESWSLAERHYGFARYWHEGLGLEFGGVDLGDMLEYDVLQVIGKLLVEKRDGQRI